MKKHKLINKTRVKNIPFQVGATGKVGKHGVYYIRPKKKKKVIPFNDDFFRYTPPVGW